MPPRSNASVTISSSREEHPARRARRRSYLLGPWGDRSRADCARTRPDQTIRSTAVEQGGKPSAVTEIAQLQRRRRSSPRPREVRTSSGRATARCARAVARCRTPPCLDIPPLRAVAVGAGPGRPAIGCGRTRLASLPPPAPERSRRRRGREPLVGPSQRSAGVPGGVETPSKPCAIRRPGGPGPRPSGGGRHSSPNDTTQRDGWAKAREGDPSGGRSPGVPTAMARRAQRQSSRPARRWSGCEIDDWSAGELARRGTWSRRARPSGPVVVIVRAAVRRHRHQLARVVRVDTRRCRSGRRSSKKPPVGDGGVVSRSC